MASRFPENDIESASDVSISRHISDWYCTDSSFSDSDSDGTEEIDPKAQNYTTDKSSNALIRFEQVIDLQYSGNQSESIY